MNGRQRISSACQPSHDRQSSNFQNVTQKELFIWCEVQRQAQRVSVNLRILRHCLKSHKFPLNVCDGHVDTRNGSSTSERHGYLSHNNDGSLRGGDSGGRRRGSMQHTTTRGSERGNRTATLWTDHAARRRTSDQQQRNGPASHGNDRPPHNRGSSRGRFTANYRPHRSRNAIVVVEALTDNDQTRLAQSKVGMLVNKRFEVQQILDQGSYGQIYVGFDHLLLRKVAVKFDEGKRKADRSSKRNHLKDEYEVYTAIRKNSPGGRPEGIPEPFWYGEEFGFRILALELLGATLHALFTFCDYKFGLETVFELGKQMIQRVRVVHESGYIHCDVKPENFLMGVGGEENVLYLIDFGLSRKYRQADEDGTLKHISQEKTSKGYVGTAKYASLNSLRCQPLSRRDDLESVAYVLAEMIKGEAPFRKSRRWHGEDVRLNKRERYLHSKEQVDWNRACPQMAAFIDYCKRLSFEEEPDYDYLMKCLRHATTRSLASYPSLTVESLECYPCRRKKAMAEQKRDARSQRLNDSIVSGADAQMAAAMRRSSAFPPAISRPQLSCKTDIDLADCQKLEWSGVTDFDTYANRQARAFGWKCSQDSMCDSRKCCRCEERLKSFYDAEKQRTGSLSWQVQRRINDHARTLYGHRFWWTTPSFLNACEDQQ